MVKRQIKYFVENITPVNFCGKTVLYQLSFDGELNGVFELPFEIEPTTGEHDFNNCETCLKNLKEITEQLTKKYNGNPKQPGFPFCCKAHSNLLKVKEYRKEAFDDVPQMVARKIIYTSQHIQNNYKRDDWYKITTDYINWVIESLGRMPNGCGEGLFASDYIFHIRDMVKRTKILSADKKKKITDFLASFTVAPKEDLPDFQILIQTYEKWFKIFPFDLNSYFGNLKKYYEKTLPIFQSTPETNLYSGYVTAIQHTKISLIDTLIRLTKNLLYQINAATLLEKGLLTDTTKIKYELVVNSRKLELNDLYKIDFPDEEKGYLDILKRWFNDEKNFVDEIRPLLKDNLIAKDETKLSLPEIIPSFMADEQNTIRTFEEMENWLRQLDNQHYQQLIDGFASMEEYIHKNVFENVHADNERLNQLNRNLTNWKHQIQSIFVEPIRESTPYLSLELQSKKKATITKLQNKIAGALEVIQLRAQKDSKENDRPADGYSHREIIIAHYYKVKAGLEIEKTAPVWKAERGEKARQQYYTTLKQSDNYKEPSRHELLNVIQLLKDFPSAQKMAINKHAQLESL